jgi:tetratricopeptide (TPR) repeat protein
VITVSKGFTSILEAILRLINTALPALLALSFVVSTGSAWADRWEKYPGRGNRADWEKSWAIVRKDAYPRTEKGDWKGAMPLLERAIKIYPGDSFYHFLLAMALSNTGNKAAAVPEFEKAMTLDPSDDHCPYYLALIYDEQKNFKKSKELYEKAIKASPANPEPWAGLAMATMEADGAKKALEVYARAKKMGIKDPMLYHNAGCIQLASFKNYKEAEINFRDALKIEPKLYQSKAGLGETLLRKGSYREALKVLQEASRMPEAKDPKRAKELNGYIKECKIKLAPKKKKKKKAVVKPGALAPAAAPATSAAAPAQ